ADGQPVAEAPDPRPQASGTAAALAPTCGIEGRDPQSRDRLTGDSRRRTNAALGAAHFPTFVSRFPRSTESLDEARLLRRLSTRRPQGSDCARGHHARGARCRAGRSASSDQRVIEKFAQYRGSIEQAVANGKVI